MLSLDLKEAVEDYHIAQQKTIHAHLNDGFFYQLPAYIWLYFLILNSLKQNYTSIEPK